VLDSANQALQQRVLTGGLFGGGGACDCSGDECALCQANFGAGALDLDRVDSLTRDSPVLGVGDMPAIGGMPADAINSIDEIAAWQGTVYGSSEPLVWKKTDVNTYYLHLYFAWNIADPDIPCHRDMWQVSEQGGCGIWRAVIPLLRGSSGWAISGSIKSLSSVWRSDDLISFSHWFPSVKSVSGRVFLAHNMQLSTGRGGNYSVWTELQRGIDPVDSKLNILENSRFPTFTRNAEEIALMTWELGVSEEGVKEDYYNIEYSPLSGSNLSLIRLLQVSNTADLFEDTAEDPAFALSPHQTCLVYQGKDSSNRSLPMLACQEDGRHSFDERVADQVTADRCGHPAVTGDGRWMVCSDNAIYGYPLFSEETSDDGSQGAQELRGTDGGELLDINILFENGVIDFYDYNRRRVDLDTDTIVGLLQVYASWGGTDDLMVFTAMPMRSDEETIDGDNSDLVVASKIFLLCQIVGWGRRGDSLRGSRQEG
jgi:hypothetical protein